MVLLILLSLAVSLVNRELMPLTAYFLWLLVARILLSFRPLVVVATVDAVAGSLALLVPNGLAAVRWVAVVEFLLAVLLVLYVAGRLRSALPSTLSESLLGKLRDRLQAQGRMPPLPEGWQSQTAMLASDGASYAGDFLVANLHEDRELEVILVDVCGKGTGAGPAALQFAGALGGLIGALPPEQLFRDQRWQGVRDRGARHTGGRRPGWLAVADANAVSLVDPGRGEIVRQLPTRADSFVTAAAAVRVLGQEALVLGYADGVLEAVGTADGQLVAGPVHAHRGPVLLITSAYVNAVVSSGADGAVVAWSFGDGVTTDVLIGSANNALWTASNVLWLEANGDMVLAAGFSDGVTEVVAFRGEEHERVEVPAHMPAAWRYRFNALDTDDDGSSQTVTTNADANSSTRSSKPISTVSGKSARTGGTGATKTCPRHHRSPRRSFGSGVG